MVTWIASQEVPGSLKGEICLKSPENITINLSAKRPGHLNLLDFAKNGSRFLMYFYGPFIPDYQATFANHFCSLTVSR